MKTILYLITQSEFGGAQKYVLDLSLGFKDEFNICVGMGGEEKEGEFARKLEENNLKYYILKNLKREISPVKDFFAIFEIIKLINKLKPDIIHLNSSKISILGSIAAMISRLLLVNCKPRLPAGKLLVVYTVHGWVFNEPLAKWKKSFYFFAEKLTALFKDKIICINKLDCEIAENKLKIKEKKLFLVYHGIKTINFLTRGEAREKLSQIINNSLPQMLAGENKPVSPSAYRGGREERGATPPHPIPLLSKERGLLIGTIANLYKTKGLEYLIEAIKILTTHNSQLITLIVGEGKERKNLEDLIKKYNLEKNVFLLGNIKNAAELLPAFDIYICSSVKEGLPYSIMEAMSAGLPIVSTNVGGIPEMITDGKNGLLVGPKNPEELAERIKTLIENKELQNTLSQQTKKDVKEKFGIEKMIEKTKEVYFD